MRKIFKPLVLYVIKLFGNYRALGLLLNEWELKSLQFASFGYIFDKGWFQSFESKKPVNLEGDPLPWITYPFISFFEERIKARPELTLFEYGSGNSTLYYSKYFKHVTTVELKREWYDALKPDISDNVELLLREDEADYIDAAGEGKYDVIIIDGYRRLKCGQRSLPNLAENGVIIVDDTDREEEIALREWIMEQGFRKIDFWGIAPGVMYHKCTTVLYRDNNCLGI